MATPDPVTMTAAGAQRGRRPPLDDVRVLDLTQVLAGPYCTMMLGDLGAEIVKIEQPGRGDDTRRVGRYRGRGPADEDYFYSLNRHKKSVALDLKHPDGKASGQALARCADVVVENFSPGTAARLGMGWEQLREINPRLIYCSISGFGQTGPYRDRLALDPIIQGMSGVMSVTGQPDGEPTGIGAPIFDVVAGMFGAYAILGALRTVEWDGEGRYIDVSMQDATLAVLGPRMAETLQAGISPARIGNENPLRFPSGTFLAADGQYVNVIVSNDRHWAPFCRALEREDWIADPRFAVMAVRIQHRQELNALVSARFAERPAAEWLQRLVDQRVPAGPVNDYGQALADCQVAHRGLIRTVDHPRSGPIRVVGPPWQIPGEDQPLMPPPLLGQHTEEVLRDWLGWGPAEIERLRSAGAI